MNKTILKHLDILIKHKRYEDYLLMYVHNYPKLPDFFELYDVLGRTEKQVIMEYITLSKTPVSPNLRKILNSSYFYKTIKIDEYLGN